MSPSAFRLPQAPLTLALVFDDLKQGAYDRWAQTARDYRDQFEARWGGLNFTYDADEDGLIDGGAEPSRKGATTSYWLNSRA